MIQRIQSVYLVIALALHVSLFYFPVFTLTSLKPGQPVKAYVLKIYQYETIPNTADEKNNITLFPLILNSLLSIIILLSIFWFKNRPRQFQLIRFIILLDLGLIACIVFKIENIKDKINLRDFTYSYHYSITFTIVTLVLFFIAGRAIMKDEEKVRAADRIR